MKKLSMLLALLLALTVSPLLPNAFAEESTYAQTLFDQSSPIVIDIQMEKEAWDHMIATASEEEYSPCNLVVNGVLYENVAIRPKGNSSMASVTSRGSQRYSWRIKFDKYEKKRTCDGLDILILNNGFKDPGELREALAYDMYAFLDADASLYNYAIVYLNGEYFGCYLALEGVDKSFAKRVYGEEYGQLYKPDIDKGGDNVKRENSDSQDTGDTGNDDGFGDSFGGSFGGQAGGNDNGFGESFGGQAGGGQGTFPSMPEQGAQPQGGGDFPGGQIPNMNGFAMPGIGGGGAKSDSDLAMSLNYVGDDLETYQKIWDSAKFKSDDEDHARVVEALKHVSERDDIGNYVDVDNVLKYMAIQAFIYNSDGLTGSVSHNYYLYEEDGKLNLLPWDMNESFSVSGNGNDFVNFPIDTPFTVDLSQRDFFMALLENEEYLARYHEYLRILSEEYALGGGLEETYNRLRSQIDSWVEADPTAFSTYAEFNSAAESLKLAIELRAQGVLGQLSGGIPSTRAGQEAEPDKLMDVSSEDLSGLTSGYGMGMGGGGFTMPNIPGFR